MAAPYGNEFWKLRSRHGREKLFSAPELLWGAACEYFEWCDANPWVSRKVKFKSQGEEVDEAQTQRPYSISGLCLYLGVSRSYWYKAKESATDDFLDVIISVEDVIETQQFEGAVVGTFNSTIIARKLGVMDKSEKTNTIGEDSLGFLNFLKKANVYDK